MSTALFGSLDNPHAADTRPGFDVIHELENLAAYEAGKGRQDAAVTLYRAAGSLYEQWGDYELACEARRKADPAYVG